MKTPVDMTDLWTLCPHLSTEAHWWPAPLDQNENCPGGHRATVEEVKEWLKEEGMVAFAFMGTCPKCEMLAMVKDDGLRKCINCGNVMEPEDV